MTENIYKTQTGFETRTNEKTQTRINWVDNGESVVVCVLVIIESLMRIHLIFVRDDALQDWISVGDLFIKIDQ